MKCLKKVLPAVLGVVCLLSLLAFPAWALLDAQEPYIWYTDLQQDYSHTWDFATDDYNYLDGAVSGDYYPIWSSVSKNGPEGSTQMRISRDDWGRTSVYVFPAGGIRQQDEGYADSGYNPEYTGKLRSDKYIIGGNCGNSVNSGTAVADGFRYAEEVLHVGYRRFNNGGSSLGHIDYKVTVYQQ